MGSGGVFRGWVTPNPPCGAKWSLQGWDLWLEGLLHRLWRFVIPSRSPREPEFITRSSLRRVTKSPSQEGDLGGG